MSVKKKMIYILNHVSEADSQHYIHIISLLKALQERGWSVILISEKGGHGIRPVMGMDVHYMSNKGDFFRLFRLAFKLVKFRIMGFKLAFVRISIPAAIVAILFFRVNTKVLFWHSGTIKDFNEKMPTLNRAKSRALLSFVFKFSDYLVTGPESMAKYYNKNYKVPFNKIEILYNDINTDNFTSLPHKSSSGSVIKLLLVHRLSKVRETTRYMPAIFSAIDEFVISTGENIEFNIIGNGDEMFDIFNMAREMKKEGIVIFHGEMSNKDVLAFYQDSDIFLMPSYREGFPRVLLEAMACGLPIVSTDAGGARDLFGAAQGEFIVDRADADLFATRLLQLLGDGQLRMRLAKENLERVKLYSTVSVAKMYDDRLSLII